MGESIEDKPCSDGWFYSQREAKEPVLLANWEYADLYATKEERAAQSSRVATLYDNACAVISWTLDDISIEAKRAIFKALASADTSDAPAGQSQISSREVVDLLIMADSLDGSPDDIQRAIDEKLGLFTEEDVAALSARREALNSYASAYFPLAAAGWQAPSLITIALDNGDYSGLNTLVKELDAAAVVSGHTSWGDLIAAAYRQVSAVTAETSAIGLTLAGASDLAETVRLTSELGDIGETLAVLGSNAGSTDPLSFIGRLIVGAAEEHRANAIAALGAGEIDFARKLTDSAMFSRDSAWAIGTGALLLIAAVGLWLSYQTQAGKRRMKPVVLKVKRRLRR
jgi:hypothetical protein